jgi:hypothetical protein
MNKFQKASLAIIVATGMAFAAGSLWRVGAPYGIAQFDWIQTCLADPDFDETDSEDPCYKQHGGWWFGYVAGPSSGPAVGECDLKRNEAFKSDPANNYVKAKIDDQWVSFVGPDYDSPPCQGPPFTDKEAGGAYLIDHGLELELNIGPGVDATYQPAIAAVGINFSQPKSNGLSPPTDRDFTSKGGFCLTYELSGLDGQPEAAFAMELGWNEDDAAQEPESAKVPYDTWFHPIPPGSGVQVKDFPWTAFEQEGWSTVPWALAKATGEMRSLKIRLKAPATPYNPIGPVRFKLIQLGWKGECDAKSCARDDLESCGGSKQPPVPIISGGAAVANASFKQAGRIFNLLASVEKPVAVQVINLQGAIVHSQTMSANNAMNLSNLPTGIYMLRLPSLGYTSKVILK